jgi:hypothetical protein
VYWRKTRNHCDASSYFRGRHSWWKSVCGAGQWQDTCPCCVLLTGPCGREAELLGHLCDQHRMFSPLRFGHISQTVHTPLSTYVVTVPLFGCPFQNRYIYIYIYIYILYGRNILVIRHRGIMIVFSSSAVVIQNVVIASFIDKRKDKFFVVSCIWIFQNTC